MSTPGRKPEVSDDEILAVLRESDEPVLTAGEVAAKLVIGRRSVHDRLVDLHERGLLGRKDVGPRAVWWVDSDADDVAPAAPLRNIVGLLDEEAAERARARSREWRESFDDELQGTEES